MSESLEGKVTFDVGVIGGGSGGFAAALAAARSGLKVQKGCIHE